MPPKEAGTKRKAALSNMNIGDEQSERDTAFKDALYSDTSSDDEHTRGQLNKRGLLKRKARHKPKRPRTAKPVAADLTDNEVPIDDHANAQADVFVDNKGVLKIFGARDGPQLKINLADILVNNGVPLNSLLHNAGLAIVSTKPQEEVLPAVVRRKFFTALPLELREGLYQDIFVGIGLPITFTDRTCLAKSAQFLRTCRVIHNEGTEFLYGHNSFHFTRCHNRRGTYYEKIWKEIGYKDIRRFLIDIGPQNLGKIRYVSFDFEDALPTFTPYLTSEERICVYDANLVEILNLFGKYTELYKFAVGFRSRRCIETRDYHFLRALCSIRCHEMYKDESSPPKVGSNVWRQIRSLCITPPLVNSDTKQKKNKFVPVMRNIR